jgi:inner membrane protein
MLARAFRNSVGLRMIIIGVLSLVMLTPAVFVSELIDERQQRRDTVIAEVSEKWGAQQTISGPVLTVPYKALVQTQNTDEKGVVRTATQQVTQYAHILPDTIDIRTALTPEVRYRGIYQIVLYRSVLRVRGRISLAGLKDLSVPFDDFYWNDAFVGLGLSDVKGIRDSVSMLWNGTKLEANPGLPTNDVLASGLAAKPVITRADADAKAQYEFTVDMNLNGSGELFFTPLGRQTHVAVSAAWGDPSFVGAFLPVSREVSGAKFSAEWNVLHLNRNYPQQWTGVSSPSVGNSTFGVKLKMALDEYQKTTRSAKYAIMFIVLTFLAFFMAEVLNKRVLHPIQYVLIGLALSIFYTLLLSISEQTAFNRAYLLSSVAIIGLIGLYTRSVLGSNLAAGIITGILTVLYGFLFIVLQLEDYALLMGSVGLFVILALVMYITRKVDWFNVAGDAQVAADNAAEN